jgi:hypothetical protein
MTDVSKIKSKVIVLCDQLMQDIGNKSSDKKRIQQFCNQIKASIGIQQVYK